MGQTRAPVIFKAPFLQIITADKLHDGLEAFRRAVAEHSGADSVAYYFS